MKKRKILVPTELQNEIYIAPYNKKVIIIISLILFIVPILSNFAPKTMIKDKISLLLSSNPNCPISHDGINFGIFPPRVYLQNVQLGPTCIAGSDKALSFKEIDAIPFGFSFDVLGIRIKSNIYYKNARIEVYPAVGFSGYQIKAGPSKISMPVINDLLSAEIQAQGNLIVEANIQTDFVSPSDSKVKGKARAKLPKELLVKSLDLRIKSDDLKLDKQMIQILQVPELDLKHFDLTLTAQNLRPESSEGLFNFDVKRFEIGQTESPLELALTGSVKLNKNNPASSELNLTGKYKETQKFKESVALSGLLFKGKKADQDGYIKFTMSGRAQSAIFNIK